MDQTDIGTVQPAQDRQTVQSPSSRRRPSGRAAKLSPFHHPRLGRAILIAMIALTVVHLVFTIYTVRRAAAFYGATIMGSTRREARYAMGTPTRIALSSGLAVPGNDGADLERSRRWFYAAGTATTEVGFGDGRRLDGGRLDRVTCRDARLDSFGCPAALGVTIGTFEDQIWYRLGAPDRESYQGDTKSIGYDALGLTFALRRFQVVAITLADAGPGAPYLSRLPRILVP